jgi:hypothetical protein
VPVAGALCEEQQCGQQQQHFIPTTITNIIQPYDFSNNRAFKHFVEKNK